MDQCRCREIEVLRDEEALSYADGHLSPVHHGGYDASLYRCRTTGLLFHYSKVVTHAPGRLDLGPEWLRRVPGIHVTDDGPSPEAAREATRVGQDAWTFHRPLVAHYIDQHGDGDVYSDPETGILYLLVRGYKFERLKRPDELLAVTHLSVTDFDRNLPLVSEPIRTRTCRECGNDMTDVPIRRACPACGAAGWVQQVDAMFAREREAQRRRDRIGCIAWLVGLAGAAALLALAAASGISLMPLFFAAAVTLAAAIVIAAALAVILYFSARQE